MTELYDVPERSDKKLFVKIMIGLTIVAVIIFTGVTIYKATTESKTNESFGDSVTTGLVVPTEPPFTAEELGYLETRFDEYASSQRMTANFDDGTSKTLSLQEAILYVNGLSLERYNALRVELGLASSTE
uniref:Uncharacterized protein n=1 Tax=viral metagenome TaxID=1070528 RepID=A0A6H1ZGP3_9ZZZZ